MLKVLVVGLSDVRVCVSMGRRVCDGRVRMVVDCLMCQLSLYFFFVLDFLKTFFENFFLNHFVLF